jgi:preprotein translocase subunit YajC
MPQNLVLPLLLGVFAVMLFVQSRNRRKQAAAMASALEPGCEVVLTSGIYATVDAIADDRLIVTTAGTTTIEIARGAIVRITRPASENKTPTSAAASKVASSKAATSVAPKATSSRTASKKPAAKTPVKKSPAKEAKN